MSFERVERKSGVVWRVRWRDASGRAHSKVVGRKRDTEAFEAEIVRRKRTGEIDLFGAGKQTLAEFRPPRPQPPQTKKPPQTPTTPKASPKSPS